MRGHAQDLGMAFRLSIACLFALLFCAGCARPPRPPASLASEHAEIAQLYARFSSAANEHRWDAMAELFGPDASWEASAGALGFRHRGRQAIHAWLRGNQSKVEVVSYLAAPPTVELLTPGRARGQTSMHELLLLKPSGEVKELFGIYRDELYKSEGRWRFAARRFELRRMQP